MGVTRSPRDRGPEERKKGDIAGPVVASRPGGRPCAEACGGSGATTGVCTTGPGRRRLRRTGPLPGRLATSVISSLSPGRRVLGPYTGHTGCRRGKNLRECPPSSLTGSVTDPTSSYGIFGSEFFQVVGTFKVVEIFYFTLTETTSRTSIDTRVIFGILDVVGCVVHG